MIMIDKYLTFTVETTALLILYSVTKKEKNITGVLKSATWYSINTDHTDSYVEARKGET